MARIEAVWQDETGTSRVSRGKLKDLSDGGLSIRIPDPILVGSKLIVRMPLGNFSGPWSSRAGLGRITFWA